MNPVQCFEWMVMSVLIHFMILFVYALGVLLPIAVVFFLLWMLVTVIQRRTSSSDVEARELLSQRHPVKGTPHTKPSRHSKLPWKVLVSFLLIPFLSIFISAQKACPAALQARAADTGGFLDDGDVLMTGAGWQAVFLALILSGIVYVFLQYISVSGSLIILGNQ